MGTFDHVVIKSTLRVMLISLVRTCIPSSSLLNVTAAINSSFVCKRGGGVTVLALTPVLTSVCLSGLQLISQIPEMLFLLLYRNVGRRPLLSLCFSSPPGQRHTRYAFLFAPLPLTMPRSEMSPRMSSTPLSSHPRFVQTAAIWEVRSFFAG